jgi:hypothetical protein
MTRSNRKKSGSEDAAPSDEVVWGGFIDLRLNDADREAYNAWTSDNEIDLWALFDDCLGKGLKYSCSWDSENECYVSTFTATLELSIKYRYVLTSRSSSWERSLFLLLFKHYVLLKENWATFKPSTGRGAEL